MSESLDSSAEDRITMIRDLCEEFEEEAKFLLNQADSLLELTRAQATIAETLVRILGSTEEGDANEQRTAQENS